MKLYGLPTCFSCKMAKKMLEKRNIDFTYHAPIEDMDKLPVLEVDGKRYVEKEAMLYIRKIKNEIG